MQGLPCCCGIADDGKVYILLANIYNGCFWLSMSGKTCFDCSSHYIRLLYVTHYYWKCRLYDNFSCHTPCYRNNKSMFTFFQVICHVVSVNFKNVVPVAFIFIGQVVRVCPELHGCWNLSSDCFFAPKSINGGHGPLREWCWESVWTGSTQNVAWPYPDEPRVPASEDG